MDSTMNHETVRRLEAIEARLDALESTQPSGVEDASVEVPDQDEATVPEELEESA